jgi:DNA-binding transcriptional MerR regulator
VWEKRYRAVVPRRTETNRRVYSESDIKRLQLLAKAVDSGHSISQVAGLSADELLRLINPELPDGAMGVSRSGKSALNAAQIYEISLANVRVLDAAAQETTLAQAEVDLTGPELIEGVIVPLCGKMGEFGNPGR